MNTASAWIDRGIVPAPLVRLGIRRLLRERLRHERERHSPDRERALAGWLAEMRRSPLAVATREANEQHYELPPTFFRTVLGPRLKYSSCLYERGDETLAEAEDAMLALTCTRAALTNGQRVLELGCGWGSLTLWMAERYPESRVVAVSNSALQREFIESRARERGLDNVRVLTADMNEFAPDRHGEAQPFDRVVSVEMFEHMRNWELLLGRVATWLAPQGRFFAHVFAHRSFAYPFEDVDESDWMSRHFFTGGMMPSADLFARVDAPFEVEESWRLNGRHYARTAEDWLANLRRGRRDVLPVLRTNYGEHAQTWFHRWAVFFMACAELFAYDGGREWLVAHTLLRPSRERRA